MAWSSERTRRADAGDYPGRYDTLHRFLNSGLFEGDWGGALGGV